ncbi:polysaccharide lyase family 7 protein, partial [Vibrio owensii]
AYGQCSVKTGDNFWATGCEGTGDFEMDKKNGDYSSATFSVLKLNGK